MGLYDNHSAQFFINYPSGTNVLLNIKKLKKNWSN